MGEALAAEKAGIEGVPSAVMLGSASEVKR